MQIALVYHPQMATARLNRVAALARVLAARGHGVSHHNSGTFQAAVDAPAADLVCICGGDGTAQLVIAGQSDPAALPALAIYPTGTINLLARELDYPADPQRFAARIEQGRRVQPVTLSTVNGRAFLCCLSVGADAHAVAALSPPLKARIGRLAYLVAMVRALARWPRTRLQVDCDGQQFTAEALFVLRCKFYAGPWTLDPMASLAQASLRVLILPHARRRDLAGLALRTLLGAGKPLPGSVTVNARHIAVRSAQLVPVQVDGDAGGHTPLEVTMTPQTVHFV